MVRDYGVYFGYDNLGEGNIDFWLFMPAADRLASFEVRSELINQLHAGLSEEEITINHPVRTLDFPEAFAGLDGQPKAPPGDRVAGSTEDSSGLRFPPTRWAAAAMGRTVRVPKYLRNILATQPDEKRTARIDYGRSMEITLSLGQPLT